MNDAKPLRIFVAMPGTDMGPHASYKNPDSVKRNLLEPVAVKLRDKLAREVELVIEKEKLQTGDIYESMFGEARDAEVYIADLSGANPNVYLELGVRWALRDNVTVPIAQSLDDVRFNTGSTRVFFYKPDIMQQAINDVTQAILNGLERRIVDSPVRNASKWVEIPKSTLEGLHAEIERLRRMRGEDLLRAAASKRAADRLELLEQAAQANPASVEVLLELGKAYRELSEYEKAVKALNAAQRLDPNNAVVHRELGVSYSKQNQPELAARSLREAVRLAPKDVEALSNLGGALRRIGMAGAPHSYDRDALREARDTYEAAHQEDKFNLYAGLNVARLNILLSKWEPGNLEKAKKEFSNLLHLCRYEVGQNNDDYWRHFDLADALLFSGDFDQAHARFAAAAGMVPPEKRRDVIGSVLGPLKDYLTAGVLIGDLGAEVEKVVRMLEGVRGSA